MDAFLEILKVFGIVVGCVIVLWAIASSFSGY
jgi:hypothetical protein